MLGSRMELNGSDYNMHPASIHRLPLSEHQASKLQTQQQSIPIPYANANSADINAHLSESFQQS
jgi:hypothetical protein